jgi:hypothetical protein
VPAANRPGHRPEDEQDKPDGAAFVEKARRLAAEEPAPEPDGGVGAERHDDAGGTSERADRLARAAGTPFRVAGDALQKVRDRL